MAYVTSGRSQGLNIVGRIAGLIADMRASWAAYAVFRETYNELSGLSDRELNDLGIARGEITRLALDAAYGEDAN